MKPSERIKDIADGYVANYPEAIMFFLDEQAELLETHTVKEDIFFGKGQYEPGMPEYARQEKENKDKCEMYRMKKPESSLRKKFDEGTRPCSFDEVEDFIRQAISEAEHEAEQRGYEKGKAEFCVSRLSSINK